MSRSANLFFLGIILFIGGILILSSDIGVGRLFLGLPATQFGIIFLIFTFDKIVKDKIGPKNYKMVSCSICGKQTLAFFWEKEAICEACQQKLSKEHRKSTRD